MLAIEDEGLRAADALGGILAAHGARDHVELGAVAGEKIPR
jgi:hypothetical protein